MQEEFIQEHILSEHITNKIYSKSSILIATALAGPFVTGYFLAQNYKLLGETDKVKRTWIISISSSIVFFIIAGFLPRSIPNIFYIVFYTTIARFVINKYQGALIDLHIANGGNTYNIWRAIFIALIVLALFVVLALGLFFLQDTFYSRTSLKH